MDGPDGQTGTPVLAGGAPLLPAAARARLDRTLIGALRDARAARGGKAAAVEDPDRQPLTYDRLLLAAHVLGRAFARLAKPGEPVGVLLPNVAGVAVVFFALQATGRVPAMLNFTAGLKNLQAACAIGGLRTVVTARRFVEQGKLDDVIAGLGEVTRVVYLEDLRAGLGRSDKLLGALATKLPALFAPDRARPDDLAVLLFTSGSEGVPKGVALSHRNLLANVEQILAHIATDISFGPEDVVFNPLPVFHSYGLTGGMLLPLLAGMRCVLYPSPLHYRAIPKLVGETGATVLFGTDTFLMGYARAADDGDLSTVRIVVAGAERVKDATREAWRQRSAAVLLEGYGATECSPVLAVNTPDHNRPGTVGRFLPGIAWRLEPVAGLADGGRLHVAGPNVMLGYVTGPGRVEPPPDGWHDTGDIVGLDADGFVTIKGRAKRFAKIGGEMVSLAAVESHAAELWPGSGHVAVAVPDPRKGEAIVLVTDRAEADRAAFHTFAREAGIPEIMLPRHVLVVAAIPVLGSGKTDYPGVTTMVRGMQGLL